MNLANKLTISRICLVPLFLLMFYLPIENSSLYAAIIFIIASITDTLDGYVARKYDLISNFGKFIDPIADKLLVTSAFIILVQIGKMDAIIAIIMISREFIISGFRLVAAVEGIVIAAAWLGKIKTVLQIIAIVAMLLADTIYAPIGEPLAYAVMILAMMFSILSAIEYFMKNKQVLNQITSVK